MSKLVCVALTMVIALSLAWSQEQTTSPPSMSDMSGMDNRTADESHSGADDMSAAHAMHSMESHHMDMGPHMKMTALRDAKPGDDVRAAKVAEAARQVGEKYKDYRAALNDGYKIFLPNVPQKQYHFTNRRNAIEAAFRFNPERPTSLLYEKNDEGYKLIGVMYTAPKRATEDDLDKRIPLSVAQWHEHVNFCVPPEDKRQEMWGSQPKFGLAGSIHTKEECVAEGGKFKPVIFNWMVHVYPFEQNPGEIWSAERQHDRHPGD